MNGKLLRGGGSVANGRVRYRNAMPRGVGGRTPRGVKLPSRRGAGVASLSLPVVRSRRLGALPCPPCGVLAEPHPSSSIQISSATRRGGPGLAPDALFASSGTVCRGSENSGPFEETCDLLFGPEAVARSQGASPGRPCQVPVPQARLVTAVSAQTRRNASRFVPGNRRALIILALSEAPSGAAFIKSSQLF
ncbi:hypothetical protein AAFF_G00309520 [Aldrovandia affinis]|uniref:Uncharacterized protein n=1 Tax=Aldrovandia affinis TaxID=143900 RepID=A0AAD7WRV9_9TELE|nr:hypothetical protein AAFF_G00309520 [Aldrovandia affinis]